MPPGTNSPNIVVFGQTGSGKSSLINMLAGKDVAGVSSKLHGATTVAKSYHIPKEYKTYTFWDTCGLNEGEMGTVPAREAADRLVDLLKGITVSFLIYIARGRFLVHSNTSLFSRIRSACGQKVPIVLVVTGLEQEEAMEEWWTTNMKDVEALNLSFNGHACVTTIKGRGNMYEQKSRSKLWKLPNIILFGESGAGKSSIVNMIVGKSVAEVSSGHVGCTFKHGRYVACIDDVLFNIYDTAGLNEAEQGRVPHWTAVQELYTLIRSLDGVSLLIYCMRGRIKENAQANWILFHKLLCAKKVPIIAVETGLEREGDLDGRCTLLRHTLKGFGMVPDGVACIVSVQGDEKERRQYISSQERLRLLILHSYRGEPWSMTMDDWIGHIYRTTYSTKLCLFPDVRAEFTNEVGNIVDEFIRETNMKTEESEKLKSALLDAEMKLRRKFLGLW